MGVQIVRESMDIHAITGADSRSPSVSISRRLDRFPLHGAQVLEKGVGPDFHLSKFVDTVSDPVLLLDHLLIVRHVNRPGCVLLGLPRSQLVGLPFSSLVASTGNGGNAINRLLVQGAGNRVTDELIFIPRHGQAVAARATAVAVRFDDGRAGVAVICAPFVQRSQDVVGVGVDLPQSPVRSGRDELAFHVDLAIAHAGVDERISLVLLGLDRFGLVNQNFGYQAGDSLLQSVERRLSSCVEAGEAAARVAGDEFAVFIPGDANSRATTRRISQIHYALNRPFEIADQPVMLTARMGMSCYPHDGACFSTLLRCAGAALRRVKVSATAHIEPRA